MAKVSQVTKYTKSNGDNDHWTDEKRKGEKSVKVVMRLYHQSESVRVTDGMEWSHRDEKCRFRER